MPLTAVVTGDLVASTAAEPAVLDHTMALLAAAGRDIAGWTPAERVDFQRYRGDGWQMALTEPLLSLRATLYLLARLRADDTALGTRVFLGIAEAEPLVGGDLSAARGEAFVISGRGLDRMSSLRLLMVGGPLFGRLHDIIVELLEEHVRKWTREQAEAAALALHPDNPTLADMAPRLGISRQAVNYRLNGGAVQAIRRALTGWEETMELDIAGASHA